ncbi:hypothetical protein [Actinomadura parmotrematis]|uniref:Uncharacterized protein n=1 Tax=Actinomadura parmotrematis TaxID=2864039 RepID=A0ABS7FY91_9ACTN|nr:hypothetical protein [Actinomadura parmotrematis]MBW8485281.1 hypothetical protein [Actinomadura parmotrematis]
MSNPDDRSPHGRWQNAPAAAPGAPAPPPAFGAAAPPPAAGGSPYGGSGGPSGYETVTRKPVVYLPVELNGEPIGFLWASESDAAAGFVRRNDKLQAAWEAPLVWSERLARQHAAGLPARDAVRAWIGAPEDPRGGGVPAGAAERRAASLTDLDLLTNPGAPPLPQPLIADGTFADGTPVDRAKGWGPLSFQLPPGYELETAGPVVFLPVSLGDTVLGYVWAAEDGPAAFYQARRDAGTAGTNAAGPLILRLREAFERGVPALDAVRGLRGTPEDPRTGGVRADAQEQRAGSLDELRAFAGQYVQSLRLTFPAIAPGAPRGPELPDHERERVLAYLESAPAAHESSAAGSDLLDASRGAVVPAGYRTDGTWVWPASVAYYLRTHGVAPEPDLLAHIRANDHQVPALPGTALDAAIRTLQWNGVLKPPPPA